MAQTISMGCPNEPSSLQIVPCPDLRIPSVNGGVGFVRAGDVDHSAGQMSPMARRRLVLAIPPPGPPSYLKTPGLSPPPLVVISRITLYLSHRPYPPRLTSFPETPLLATLCYPAPKASDGVSRGVPIRLYPDKRGAGSDL